MSEEINNQDKVQAIDNNSVLNAFKQALGTQVLKVYVNSLEREVNFKEVSVVEQKTLSKTMIANEKRRDIIYDVQCSLINRLCLEEGFDIYRLTEFDRIRILMEIYQSNYFKNDITYKCPECGTVNKYHLDFDKIIAKLNDFDLSDRVYNLEDKYRHYNFTLNYPYVRNVSNFYKAYNKKYAHTTQKEQEVLDSMGNIEYVNLFIKQIEMVNKDDPSNRQVADLTMMSYNQIEQLISILPQNIIFSDENGVIKYITSEFIEKINKVFSYEKCAQCGAETTEGIGGIGDFF